ncbi:hypothetical protein [Alkalihalobacterium chitinilyticum]|uniref:DUF1292 domain-containing protein n=1 Tax=Alkalihalobacterium chitinilyticum TaxID=2980103 RepID=A0ABT5VCD9_9BACI|nr:hypothetical protein [Alkalihalobacterium chitinilyticum]MDE5413118.1 hypothetical protein [Alkalihalobacterium chitinilyticum]
MNLQDALYNWLSIKVVHEARPDDQAALDTYEFFSTILTEDHKLEQIVVEVVDPMYIVRYVKDGNDEQKQFPIELIEALLVQIESEPKYN